MLAEHTPTLGDNLFFPVITTQEEAMDEKKVNASKKEEQGRFTEGCQPPKIPDGRGGRRGGAGISHGRQGPGADYDALAEHLADQGHFPRVRPRLRQEGERHDRRGPQDRGAAGRRRGAGLRPAGRGLQGHARRRPRRARLPLRQAECPGAVGVEPRFRHGRQHAALLAQVRRRQGAAGEDLRSPSAPTWSPSPTGR